MLIRKFCGKAKLPTTGTCVQLAQRLEDYYVQQSLNAIPPSIASPQSVPIPPPTTTDMNDSNDALNEVCAFLESIGLKDHFHAFAEEGIDDMEIIPDLTENELNKLGITKIGHVKKFWKAVKTLKSAAKASNDTVCSDVHEEKVNLEDVYKSEILNRYLCYALKGADETLKVKIRSRELKQGLANVSKKYSKYNFKMSSGRGKNTGSSAEYKWATNTLSSPSNIPLVAVTIDAQAVENKNKSKKQGGIKQSGGSNGRVVYIVKRLNPVVVYKALGTDGQRKFKKKIKEYQIDVKEYAKAFGVEQEAINCGLLNADLELNV